MNPDALHERGQAMEDLFFRDRDQQLIQKLKAKLAAKDAIDALALATGIEDRSVLELMHEAKITAETLASVSLIPLVVVAWADGSVDEKERRAILKASTEVGLKAGEPAYELMIGWLTDRPDPELLQAWKEYVGALKQTLDAPSLSQLKARVIERARNVAQAAGGILGMGNKISESERRSIEELSEAFE